MGIRLIDDQQIIDLTCLITDAFKDKNDKCGYPYIIHCLSVANYSADLAATYFGEQNTSIQRLAYIVGLCHDCYEDLPSESIIQVNDLIVKLFPDHALDIVGVDFFRCFRIRFPQHDVEIFPVLFFRCFFQRAAV